MSDRGPGPMLLVLGLTFHETIGRDYPNHSVATNALIEKVLHNVIGILVVVE